MIRIGTCPCNVKMKEMERELTGDGWRLQVTGARQTERNRVCVYVRVKNRESVCVHACEGQSEKSRQVGEVSKTQTDRQTDRQYR